MKVAFLTLGCKVNYYETEKMKQQFAGAGHQIVTFGEKADAYVVNTCTVTNIADRKSRKMLHRARKLNSDALVVAAGCYVDSARQRGEIDGSVDLFLPNRDKERIVALVEEAVGMLQASRETPLAEGGPDTAAGSGKGSHTRAYIKVQDGCSQYCSYCIIPYVRGSLASRSQEDVVREVRELALRGYREVVVTGIHLSSYGADMAGGRPDANIFLKLGGRPLLGLLRAISQVEGVERIRLGSLEPRVITEEFARGLAEIPEICPHFHLSLQSGCDAVLRRMNRHYTTQEYLDKLDILRKYFNHPAITTDIIVGFPQESQEEFQETRQFAARAGFAKLHVFKYSMRQGTVAAAMDGQVPEEVKAERSNILLQAGMELEKEYQQFFIGKSQSVLWEEVQELQGEKYLVGYNQRYVRIAVPAAAAKSRQAACNTISQATVTGNLTDNILLGTE